MSATNVTHCAHDSKVGETVVHIVTVTQQGCPALATRQRGTHCPPGALYASSHPLDEADTRAGGWGTKTQKQQQQANTREAKTDESH